MTTARAESYPLKVVNVVEDARIGGPQRRILAVAGLLRGWDIETVVYTAEKDSEAFSNLITAQGLQQRRFKLIRLQSGISNQFRYALNTIPQIWRYVQALRQDRPDIVHVNSSAQWRPAVAARLAGVPCVWHLNDTNMPGAVMLLFKSTQRAASAFIVAGRRVESYYLPRGSGGRPVKLIHAPVDLKKFSADPTKVAADVAVLPGVKIVNVGNVNPDKDIETFVRVAAAVSARSKVPVSFVQVGGLFGSQDAYAERLKRLIAELGVNIHFLGHRNDVADVLRACDIYLHTARNEASGMAVWEAAACGLPIVTTDVADYRELVKTWPFAAVCHVGNVGEIAAQVLLLSVQPGMRTQMAAEGCKLAGKELELGTIAGHHMEVYRTLLIAKS
jgi:glycosyltransferase involved in cell wall biosynthesis